MNRNDCEKKNYLCRIKISFDDDVLFTADIDVGSSHRTQEVSNNYDEIKTRADARFDNSTCVFCSFERITET